jgi:hypothetical protein
MSSNVVNQVAYIRTTRSFPEEVHQLSVEIDKAYVDIANAVNNRTISIFPVNRPAIDGESWFFTSRRQQGLRQVYSFTTTSDINIGFKISTIAQFTNCHGLFTTSTPTVSATGTATFGLIFGTNTAIAGQISFYLDVNPSSTTSDVIKFVLGAGAPALLQGTIVLEWISEP